MLNNHCCLSLHCFYSFRLKFLKIQLRVMIILIRFSFIIITMFTSNLSNKGKVVHQSHATSVKRRSTLIAILIVSSTLKPVVMV